jgi:hypothetical protein
MKKTLLAALLFWAAQANAIGHLADLTVVDRQLNRTLPVYWHAGRAWVEGKPGNEYQVVVRNQTGSDLLAVVSVDGVNVVTGETAAPAQGGYVIDSWRNLDISGWRKSLSRTAAFYFTEIADSYAARTGRPDHVGVIGAALFRRRPDPVSVEVAPEYAPRPWQNSAPPPASSAPMRERAEGAGAAIDSSAPGRAGGWLSSPAPAAKLGTGHGRSEVSRVRTVEFERATVNPEETITIFYDSRANLVARGIIRERPLPAPREPQAFPGGFVADPPRW